MNYQLLALLLISSLLSCVSQNPPPRNYDDYRAIGSDPYNQSYGDPRSPGHRSARERVLAGTYGTQQQAQYQQPVKKEEVAEEKKGWVDPNRSIAKRYPIGNVPYGEIEPMLKKQLSSDGGISYIHRFNSVLVLDKPANHEKIKTILDAVVRDAVNIRVDLEFANSQSFSDFGITVKHSGIRIDNGGIHLPERGVIDIRDQNSRQDSNTRQFLTTMSGHPAQLWVTNTVVDRQLYNNYRFVPFTTFGGRAGTPIQIIGGVRDVGATLYMLPTYTDDGLVTIELFPVLTTEVGGKRQSFRVEKVQTRVVARPGQRVFLGGMNKSMNNFFSSIFNPIGGGKGRVTDLVNIYVTPTVMKVGPRK